MLFRSVRYPPDGPERLDGGVLGKLDADPQRMSHAWKLIRVREVDSWRDRPAESPAKVPGVSDGDARGTQLEPLPGTIVCGVKSLPVTFGPA